MTSPSQTKHKSVRAFVGILGPGSRRHDGIRQVCGRPAHSFFLGQAQVTFVDRSDETHAIDASVQSLALYTGRPFLDGRLFKGGTIPGAGELDGKFAYLVLKPDGLELSTDFLGAGAVYYAEQGGDLYFGSHLGLLVSALPQCPNLNQLGLASQLFTRDLVIDETHFAGTYRLPAGGRLNAEVNADEAVDVRITPGDGIKGLLNIEAPRYTPETFREMLDHGVEREQYGDNSMLMLSGGRDSFSIAVAHAPLPRRTATYGETYSIDFVRGKSRARKLGFEFHAVPYQDWTLETYRDEIVALNGGCSGLQTAHNIVAYDWASDKADLVAIGFLGDVFRAKYLEKIEGELDERSAVPSLLKRINDPILNELYPDEAVTLTEYAMDTFRDLARDVGAHRALAILKLQWMQARWLAATFDLCDWFVHTSYPFMQRQLLASWLQADIEDPEVRKIFGQALEQALADRGLPRDFRGTVPERLWNRSYIAALARRKGTRATGRSDWQAVIDRSQAPFENSVFGDHRLSEVTKRAWQRVLSGEDRGHLFSVAYSSAAIGAACERFLPRDSRASTDFVEPAPNKASRAPV